MEESNEAEQVENYLFFLSLVLLISLVGNLISHFDCEQTLTTVLNP
jgi:hypothetical protein